MIKVRLVGSNSPIEGRRIRVEGGTFVIGRHESCDLTIKSRSISRRHCAIVQDAGRVMIQDLGSRNGTVVNGKQLALGDACRLWHRDELKIGKCEFRLSMRDSASGQACVPDRDSTSGIAKLSGVSAPMLLDALRGDRESLSTSGSSADIDPAEGREALLARMEARQLLDELDAIAGIPINQRLSDSAELSQADESTSGTEDGWGLEVSDEDDEDAGDDATGSHDTTEIRGEIPDPVEHPVGDRKPAKPSRTKSGDGKQEPGKLPARLRPKTPEDSTAAAHEALKRMLSAE